MKTLHVFTHTHWDRDWFLPAEFTNEWLDDLFDRLFQILERVLGYQYVLDGQTIMLEDYLSRHPENIVKVRQYAQKGKLLIGPTYGQVDWRAISEESLMRNLYYGITDAKRYGNLMPVGWLLDNFGHCSQSPQIHNLFGIEDVFVWRGPVFADDKISSEFSWESPDGSRVFTHFLMSGYRNFYNLSDTQDYIEQRVDQIKQMLSPFTPHEHLILMDGYDVDVWPEDPFDYVDETNGFIRSTPNQYLTAVKSYYDENELTRLQGELFSGKYACIFPGSLSARSYLRLENAMVEKLLAYNLEPLQALVSQAGGKVDLQGTERAWRTILVNQLHDSIGGVSVDQVHDNMETAFHQVYDFVRSEISQLLRDIPVIMDLKPGMYAYLPSPYDYGDLWLQGESGIYQVDSKGMGFFLVSACFDTFEESSNPKTFTWQNDFYTFEITSETLKLNDHPVGSLTLEADNGDTYNTDPQPLTKPAQITRNGLQVLVQTEDFAIIRFHRTIRQDDIHIETEEILFFNNAPVVEWQLTVNSLGANYRLRFVYETGDTKSQVYAKMPFDITQRPRIDLDYFGQKIPDALVPVLLAAREINQVEDFPFQGFVALSHEGHTKSIFAKGLREYSVDRSGKISVTLKRSIEWLAKSNLSTRVGDAGPYMYVPGAKDERETRFDLALIDLQENVHSEAFLKWFYLFEYGFIIFENRIYQGTKESARIWEENLPWSGVHNLPGGESLIRVYNPHQKEWKLSKPYLAVDPFGMPRVEIPAIHPNSINQFVYKPPVESIKKEINKVEINLVEFPSWPVGPENCNIEQSRLDELVAYVESLKRAQANAKATLETLSEDKDTLKFHQTKHAVIRIEREIYEAKLSLLLNKLKAEGRKPDILAEIRQVGKHLNQVRRQRRTYDYILSLYENV